MKPCIHLFILLIVVNLSVQSTDVNINFKDMFNGLSLTSPQPSPAPTSSPTTAPTSPTTSAPTTGSPSTLPPIGNFSSIKVRNNAILTNHTNYFVPKQIYDLQTSEPYRKFFPSNISYRALSAVGYDLANTIWLIGPDGRIVIVDTLGDLTSVERVIADMRVQLNLSATAPLPIAALVYTHNHIDHTGGVLGYLNSSANPVCPPEDTSQPGADGTYLARANCVEIFSQRGVVNAVINTGTVVGTMINPRSAFMYGSYLGDQLVTNGIGKAVNQGTPTFHLPSRTFSNELKVNVGGLNLQLKWAPSETDDELVVFLPDALNPKDGSASVNDNLWNGVGLLLTAEVIQGPAFPNIYSLRGTSYRSPVNWFQSVDVLRLYDSWCTVPSHGPPVCGKEKIRLLLENFRDAIQYTHDQTVRFLNKGYTPDEMQSYLDRLPSYLVEELNGLKDALPSSNMDPVHYLLPLYGSVPQAVRQIYSGYLGWYTADPVSLQKLPPARQSERYIKQMGGRAVVLAAAVKALKDGKSNQDKEEYQWAAELASHLVTVNPNDKEARAIKAQAFLWLAEPLDNGSSDDWRNWDTRSIDPNWRNWYLSSMIELLGGDNFYLPPLNTGLISPAIISNLPPGAWVNSWTLRLQAEKALNLTSTFSLGFQFLPDSSWSDVGPQWFVLQIRKSVARFVQVPSNETSAAAQAPAGQFALSLWRSTNCTISLTRSNLSTALEYEAGALASLWRSKLGVFDGQDVKLEYTPPLSYSSPQTFNPLSDILKSWVNGGKISLLRGNSATFDLFLSYFDAPLAYSPHLSLR